jgi:glutaredoxin 3
MGVIVYTTKDCPWCKKTKEFFKVNKIKFREVDVGEDEKAAEEMIRKSGQQAVPVIDINGEIIVGFDEEKFKSLLKIK